MSLRPGIRFIANAESQASFEAFAFRSRDMVDELDSFLALTAERSRLLDVGACHGLFSLAFTQHPGRTAVALEPSPVAYPVLADNVASNPTRNIRCLQVAAGRQKGTLRMTLEWHHLRALADDETGLPSQDVPVRTLDAICSSIGLAPDVVKIDVEGYEMEVLGGATDLLRRIRPLLFLEIHPSYLQRLRCSAAEIHGLLTGAGYEFVTDRGTIIQRREVEGLTRTARLICRPC